MRIAFVFAYMEGSQIDSVTSGFFDGMLQVLASAGHEVRVFALSDDTEKPEERPGYSIDWKRPENSRFRELEAMGVVPVLSWTLTRVAELFRLHAQGVRLFAPDVICCVKALDGLLFSLERTTPCALISVTPQFEIMRLNFGDLLTPVDRHLTSALEILSLGEMHAVASPSLQLKEVFRSKANLAEDRLFVYPPFSLPGTSPAAKRIVECNQSPVILFFGGIESYKGADLLIEALPAVIDRLPGAELVVSAQEPECAGEECSMAERLRRRLREMHLLSKVSFVGELPRSALHQAVRNATVSVFPFRYCGCMYHVTTALEAGGPVIAANVGTIAEMLKDRETAYLVPPDDVRALAAAIIDLVEDRKLQEHLSVSAARLMKEELTSERAAAVFDMTLSRAVGAFATQREVSTTPVPASLLRALDLYSQQGCFSALLSRQYKEGYDSIRVQ